MSQNIKPPINMTGGLIIAIVVAIIVSVVFIVPAWKKKPVPPQPTDHDCKRDLDCKENLTCLNAKCTLVTKPKGFPWIVLGISSAFILFSLMAYSQAILKTTPTGLKQAVQKTLLYKSALVLVVIVSMIAIIFFSWKAYTRVSCPDKPRDICPPGQVPLCSNNTGLSWQCVPAGDVCGDDQPKCVKGVAECNPSTLKWECPEKICDPSPPKSLVCPVKKGGVDYKPRCDSGTRFEWICQPGCDPHDPGTICASGKHPGCNVDTNYKWDCVTNSSDVCGTTIKPKCEGAMCIDTDKGWDWKCPGDLTRADVIRMNKLVCEDTIIDEDTKKPISVCFTDSTLAIPIFPTIGHDCTNENATQSLGKDLDNILGNPSGNMTTNNKTFQPTDESKRIYYQPDNTRPTLCVLSDNLNYKCLKGGKFIQDKKNISKTGKCDCIAPWKGGVCQFSDATTCVGHGTVNEAGACTCVAPWKGARCQFSDATTCSSHGVTSASGHCKCNPGYVTVADSGGQCQRLGTATCCYTFSSQDPHCWDCADIKTRVNAPCSAWPAQPAGLIPNVQHDGVSVNPC